MDVHESDVYEYLTARKVRFIIPVYQRNYDWKDEQCLQLWDDIQSLSNNPDRKRTHFMGTICSKSVNSHERTIIDGQQRITTVSVLVKAIHDTIADENDKKELDESYLHNTGKGVNSGESVKLQLNKHDDAIYRKLLSLDQPSKKDFNAQELHSRICANYFFFFDKLSKLDISEIEGIMSAFERLNIIDLEIGDENAQEIFESLNSTGLDLKDVDLLRNHLLMNLDYANQSRLYDEYWSRIESNVGNDNMDRFFVDYLIYTRQSDSLGTSGAKSRQHINRTTLYHAFKIHYGDVRGRSKDSSNVQIVESLLSDMYKCSEMYKDLVFESNLQPPKSGEKDPSRLMPWTIYSITVLNKNDTARPLLLYILGKLKMSEITPDQALEMLQGCLSLVFRSKVCGYNGLTGQSAGNVIKRMDEYGGNVMSSFWRAITSGTGKFAFPSDELFKNELNNRDIYLALRSDGCRYLLYTLEQHYINSKGVDDAYPWESTTEHIMPQTLSDQWVDYLGEDSAHHQEFVHRLGNLALTDYNSELSNSDYSIKRNRFQTSTFAHTADLYKIDRWCIDRIVERGERLSNECLAIWSLPTEYQSRPPQPPSAQKRAGFKFSMAGIEKGSVITFCRDSNIRATVIDDKHIDYEGTVYSLSGLASKLLGRNNVQGPYYFLYDGKSLADLRLEYEEEQGSVVSVQRTLDQSI